MLPINVMLPASTPAPSSGEGAALDLTVLGSEAPQPIDASFAAAFASAQLGATLPGETAATLANQSALAAADGLGQPVVAAEAPILPGGTLLPWAGSVLPGTAVAESEGDTPDAGFVDLAAPSGEDLSVMVEPVLPDPPPATLPAAAAVSQSLVPGAAAGTAAAVSDVATQVTVAASGSKGAPGAATVNGMDPALAAPVDRPLSTAGSSGALSAQASWVATAEQTSAASRGENLARGAEFSDLLRFARAAEGTGAPTLMPATAGDLTAPRAATPQWTTTIPTPLDHPKWDSAVGERVVFMVKQDIQFAEIRLNPPHLGPMEVRLSVNQDQVHAVLAATHSVTREALEAALPRLRDMLADVGLNLAGANVASYSSGEQQRGGEGTYGGPLGGNGSGPDAELASSEASVVQVLNAGERGLVDVFA